MDESDNLSEGSDEFEMSEEKRVIGGGKQHKSGMNVTNNHYDEAYEVSQDLSVAESFDARDKGRGRKLKDDKFDEAFDVSQSMDQSAAFPQTKTIQRQQEESKGAKSEKNDVRSQSIAHAPYDEAFDFDQSGSDQSVDTTAEKQRRTNNQKPTQAPVSTNNAAPIKNSVNQTAQGSNKQAPQPQAQSMPQSSSNKSQQPQQIPTQKPNPQSSKPARGKDDESSEEGDAEESYENIEGAYHAKDFEHLDVTQEIKDLFEYIERYKPQEVELESTLKCFIPEFIPSIGEMDPFVKVPRPDGKDDSFGLKVLDEPAAAQSDPTVLELQLRAMSKKLQYGDVAIRSIEDAAKNPQLIEKWIQNINELHRTKPPPQVHYRREMPNIDTLMEAWPEEFEAVLNRTPLPSPDLDLSLLEYAKILCNILDIPVYDNPIESLHVMFTLYMDFRNNPHFQAQPRMDSMAQDKASDHGYMGADVMEFK